MNEIKLVDFDTHTLSLVSGLIQIRLQRLVGNDDVSELEAMKEPRGLEITRLRTFNVKVLEAFADNVREEKQFLN